MSVTAKLNLIFSVLIFCESLTGVMTVLCCVMGSLSVCRERSIPRMVYTSTINVVFTGKPIEEGDEASVPYVPPDVVSTKKH